MSKQSTLKFGTEFWKADEKDHGKYDEPEALGKVPGVPKRIFYLGFTHMNEDYTLATRIVRNEDVYNKTNKLFESKNRINSNVTMPLWGGDLVFDVSGEIDDASTLKSIMLLGGIIEEFNWKTITRFCNCRTFFCCSYLVVFNGSY